MSGVQNIAVSEDDAGIRLDRWFQRHFLDLNHSHLQKLLRTGQVRVDGRRSKGATRLGAGQVIRVPPLGGMSRPSIKRVRHQSLQLEGINLKSLVLYKDKDILAINKPPGLAVQGGTNLKHHLDGLLDELRLGAPERPRLVHRLDKDTGGVLILARNSFAAAKISSSFRSRDVHKLYWALVVGVPCQRRGKITSDMAKSGASNYQKITEVSARGKRAVTVYEVIQTAGGYISWLAMWPETGRTHQLRVHCSSLGTPILGDGKYGGRKAFMQILTDTHFLHLHARSLEIPHPRGGILNIKAPLSEKMASTWQYFEFTEHVTESK